MAEKKDPVAVLNRILFDDVADDLAIDYTFGAEKEGNGNVSIYCNKTLAVELIDYAIAIYNEQSTVRVVCHQRDIADILRIMKYTEDAYINEIEDDYDIMSAKSLEEDAEVLLNLAWLHYCLINIESGKGSCIIDFVNSSNIKKATEQIHTMYQAVKESEEE